MSDKYNYKYRLNLDFEELEILQKIFKDVEVREDDEIIFKLLDAKVKEPKKIKHSYLKHGATIKATEARTQKAKQSIQETIKSLCSEDMKPTKYQVHKRTGIAYATLNKYYDEILQELESKK